MSVETQLGTSSLAYPKGKLTVNQREEDAIPARDAEPGCLSHYARLASGYQSHHILDYVADFHTINRVALKLLKGGNHEKLISDLKRQLSGYTGRLLIIVDIFDISKGRGSAELFLARASH